jgi:hypothetical protein
MPWHLLSLRPTYQPINGSTPASVGPTVPGRPRAGARHEVRHIIASRDEARSHASAADERDARPYLRGNDAAGAHASVKHLLATFRLPWGFSPAHL